MIANIMASKIYGVKIKYLILSLLAVIIISVFALSIDLSNAKTKISKASIPQKAIAAASVKVQASLPALASTIVPHALPVTSKAVAAITPIPKVFVPIIMYHYIRDYTDSNDSIGVGLSVAPTTFQTQLDSLKAAGYHTISLEDYINKNYSSKPIILTFDDGYADAYTTALPILQQEGDTATFFIISSFVGQPNYMTAEQIAQLKADGMEVGSHTVDHKDLATMSYSQAYYEINTAAQGWDKVFAYPSGDYNSSTLQIVRSLGIVASVTTHFGVATELSDPEQLPRIRAKEGTNLISLINGEIYALKHPKIQ